MMYHELPGWNDDYQKIVDHKIKQMKRFTKGPYAIFLDGKNLTKNHKVDMITENSFTSKFYNAGLKLVRKLNIPCHVFAIMDEITFIFTSGEELGKTLHEEDMECALTLFTLKLYQEYKNMYDEDILFRGVIYKAKSITKTLEVRRIAGYQTALEYYVKEKGIKCDSLKAKQMLIDNGFYDEFNDNTNLHDGYYKFYKPEKEGYFINW